MTCNFSKLLSSLFRAITLWLSFERWNCSLVTISHCTLTLIHHLTPSDHLLYHFSYYPCIPPPQCLHNSSWNCSGVSSAVPYLQALDSTSDITSISKRCKCVQKIKCLEMSAIKSGSLTPSHLHCLYLFFKNTHFAYDCKNGRCETDFYWKSDF